MIKVWSRKHLHQIFNKTDRLDDVNSMLAILSALYNNPYSMSVVRSGLCDDIIYDVATAGCWLSHEFF